MSLARKQVAPIHPKVATGEFSKKEAGKMISEGIPHLFSLHGTLGKRLFALTERAVQKNQVPRFPWELWFFKRRSSLDESLSRCDFIQNVTSSLKLEKRRALREKVESVLEELLTNAIYHAQRLPNGDEKYSRQNAVKLPLNEKVEVSYGQRSNGIYLSVTDKGGNLRFDEVCRAFSRCYGLEKIPQIDTKASGAGLGLYLVFEEVTHLKIVTRKNKWTTISCWIAKSESNSNDFSFNFFEEE